MSHLPKYARVVCVLMKYSDKILIIKEEKIILLVIFPQQLFILIEYNIDRMTTFYFSKTEASKSQYDLK